MRVRQLALLVACAALLLAMGGGTATAAWPPAKGSNPQDPGNWPNDPDYGGLYYYFSWLPAQVGAPGPYVPDDVTLGASGMSVDLAWTYTVGRPDVLIAVVDNGIEWDEPELANKAFLNAAELTKHKPTDASGNACGGAGALAGFDCDGDGVFTVADYRDDPRIAPTVAGDPCHPGQDPTQTGADRILGDVNHNCLLDAGDLIELFSDGVDDDANGYTDDISGWDFLKNDNDPYDDVRYGHGTGEAKWSAAEANNGLGALGACPLCRFVALRVEEGFIADDADVAKAVVYAADNDAQVVQMAMGAVDLPAYTQAAEDYAYGRGSVLVVSMGDEDSRHHELPATSNHVLTVHAIDGDGDTGLNGGQITTTSTSFLEFVTCTNYGGQNMLSVSGHACSSEATGRGAGLAALLVSEGMNQKLSLTPEEIMQLLETTADDVDVAASRSTPADTTNPFVESKPGFDQRFGYGRPNAARAMQAIDAGLIPPEVDLVSPAWFDVFYADRATTPVPIVGRVAAKRAVSYDYRVEWAPGIEPDEDAFLPLVDWVRNVPAATATGGSASEPLGMLAPSEIDTSHTPDPDSVRFHENDRTVTLRVVAVAHYPGGIDVRGEARRAVAIVNQGNGLDPDLAPGFPLALGASLESSPKLADIDGDGLRDIVIGAADGRVHALTLRSGLPVEIAGFPVLTNPLDGLNPKLLDPSVPSYIEAPAYTNGSQGGGIDPSSAREPIVATVAVGDLDGDGKNEIVASTWPGTIYVIDSAGKLLPGWPKRLPLVPSCPLDPSLPRPTVCMDPQHQWARGAGASPVLADFDHDLRPEIVQAAFDGNIYVWHADGTPLDGWPVAVHAPGANYFARILSTPAVADFNGDGVPDVLTGSNETYGSSQGAGFVFLIDGRGKGAPGGNPYFPHWPFVVTSLDILPLVGVGVSGSPAIGDFTGSGQPQALLQGNGSPPLLVPSDPGPQSGYDSPANSLPVYEGDGGTQVGFDPTSIFGAGSQASRPDTMFPLFSSPAIGDLDQDGVLDPVMSGGSLSLAAIIGGGGGGGGRPLQFLLSSWSGATGHMMYGSPLPIEDYTFLVSQAVADITGDDYPEMMLGTGGYFVHAADACGCEAQGWPKFTDGWIITTPAVGDLDGDHKLEVVAGTREGNLFAWHTQGTDTGVIQWASFHHDNANTGSYATALGQGVLRRASQPIDCAADCGLSSTASGPRYEVGGCGCRTGAGGGDLGGALAGVGAASVLAALARWRAKRRRP